MTTKEISNADTENGPVDAAGGEGGRTERAAVKYIQVCAWNSEREGSGCVTQGAQFSAL